MKGRAVAEDPIHVLVIDDDEEITNMIRMGLSADGMVVHGAADGIEGIEVLDRERIDVVILDIMMPRVDGWMTLMDIRNNPATADIPVIMLTAKTEEQAMATGSRLPVSSHAAFVAEFPAF